MSSPALSVNASRQPGYKVDVGRGQRIGRVSSEWFSRPADERFLNLADLHRSLKAGAEAMLARLAIPVDTRGPVILESVLERQPLLRCAPAACTAA